MELNTGGVCECVFCEQDPNRYQAWVVRFRDLATGRVLEFYHPPSYGQPPATVGRRYLLKVLMEDIGGLT